MLSSSITVLVSCFCISDHATCCVWEPGVCVCGPFSGEKAELWHFHWQPKVAVPMSVFWHCSLTDSSNAYILAVI